MGFSEPSLGNQEPSWVAYRVLTPSSLKHRTCSPPPLVRPRLPRRPASLQAQRHRLAEKVWFSTSLTSCPFCQRVQRQLEPLGLAQDIELRDTRQDPKARAQLQEETGRTQVPCLFINGKTPLRVVGYLGLPTGLQPSQGKPGQRIGPYAEQGVRPSADSAVLKPQHLPQDVPLDHRLSATEEQCKDTQKRPRSLRGPRAATTLIRHRLGPGPFKGPRQRIGVVAQELYPRLVVAGARSLGEHAQAKDAALVGGQLNVSLAGPHGQGQLHVIPDLAVGDSERLIAIIAQNKILNHLVHLYIPIKRIRGVKGRISRWRKVTNGCVIRRVFGPKTKLIFGEALAVAQSRNSMTSLRSSTLLSRPWRSSPG